MKFLTAFFIFTILATAFAIEPNQWDNFQGGTTQGWGSGAPNPNPPVVVNDGGPAGTGDAYLKVTSNGTSGAGSMLITFNTNQWTGNYTSAGVTVMSMHLNNFSNEMLHMRIAIQGSGGNFWSTNAVMLPAQSGWQTIQFSLLPANLTGGADVNATLSGVTQFRILHSVAGAYTGDIVAAELGIDNITAAENPLPVELSSFTAYQNGNTAVLNWVTSSEINNLGFEIERKLVDKDEEGEWIVIGFKEGAGTATEMREYFYFDDITGFTALKSAYKLKQVDFDGSFTYSDIVYIDNIAPLTFSLLQNYPNPFNPETTIRFNLPSDEYVSLIIYNLLGKEIATLVNENRAAGSYEINFEASNLSSGIYFYKITAGNYSDLKKMIVLK